MSDSEFHRILFWIFFALSTPIVILIVTSIIQGILRQAKKSDYKQRMSALRSKRFVPEKVFKKQQDYAGGIIKYDYLAFDFTHGLFAFEYQLYPLKDVVTTELINDSTVVSSASAYQGGSMVAGIGAFAGSAQLHSGEKTALIAVRVMLDNPRTPSAMIPFLFGVVDKASKEYQEAATLAYEVYSIFESTVNHNKSFRSAQNQPESSPRAANAPQPQNGEVIYCGQCGAKNTGKNKFCNRCGSALGK